MEWDFSKIVRMQKEDPTAYALLLYMARKAQRTHCQQVTVSPEEYQAVIDNVDKLGTLSFQELLGFPPKGAIE